MKARTLFFTAPKQIEIREVTLPVLKDDEVLVETVCSSISAGTEMLVYRGEFPILLDWHDNLSSDLKYPLAYGYACVGRIKETGKHVDRSLLDKLVFGSAPHTSAFICDPSSLMMAPASFPAEACSFLPNMETAVNLVQDAAPILSERGLVLGQGVVGLLVTSLLKEFPLETLVTSDYYAIRRRHHWRWARRSHLTLTRSMYKIKSQTLMVQMLHISLAHTNLPTRQNST